MNKKINILDDEGNIYTAFSNIESGLKKYLWLQNNLYIKNVSIDRVYQRNFNHFYKVRRNSSWQEIFYSLLELSKQNGIVFKDVLFSIYDSTNRIEASFASKLVATIYPNKPIIDKFVLINLGLSLPKYYEKNRIEKILEIYNIVEEKMNTLISSEEGQEIIKKFELYYPNSGLSNMKKIDFILWQLR